MASHGPGKSVCLPATPSPPPSAPRLPSLPYSISPHNLSTPSCIWLSSRARLGFNKSLYQEQVNMQHGKMASCLPKEPPYPQAWGIVEPDFRPRPEPTSTCLEVTVSSFPIRWVVTGADQLGYAVVTAVTDTGFLTDRDNRQR
ncbi:hypothetical protein Q8A73_002482 [Channa argus]|nr:hypothetical protein Q8A73_002482 [Channa argus]